MLVTAATSSTGHCLTGLEPVIPERHHVHTAVCHHRTERRGFALRQTESAVGLLSICKNTLRYNLLQVKFVSLTLDSFFFDSHTCCVTLAHFPSWFKHHMKYTNVFFIHLVMHT